MDFKTTSYYYMRLRVWESILIWVVSLISCSKLPLWSSHRWARCERLFQIVITSVSHYRAPTVEFPKTSNIWELFPAQKLPLCSSHRWEGFQIVIISTSCWKSPTVEDPEMIEAWQVIPNCNDLDLWLKSSHCGKAPTVEDPQANDTLEIIPTSVFCWKAPTAP